MVKVFNVSFLHAKTKNQIRDGLMYRKKKLKKNQGMLFHTGLKVSSFWMKNTFIPLDVLFLNKSGKILGYKENNKPHSLKGISIGKKSFYVLEMNSGWIKKNKAKVGDKIKIRKRKTRKKRGGQGKKRKKEESSGSSGSKPAKKKTSTPEVDEATKCAICLKGTRCTRCDNAVIHCPACNGIFHRYCLSAWITTVLPQVANCPLCRVALPEKTYTILGFTHPNQVNNNNNNVIITALNVNQLYSIATPTMVTGNQGESEIQNVLRMLISNIGPQGDRARMFERMSAVRFAITRAEQVAENLVGNYNATTNQTPFLHALRNDWAALGGDNNYRYLNAFTGIASIEMGQQIQENEGQLYMQNRQRIQNATTVQGIYDIINNTINLYDTGPGVTNVQATPFYQALQDDRMYLEVLLE